MKKFRNTSRSLAVLLILAMLLPIISMTASSADIPCAEDGCSGKYRSGICSVDASHYEAAPVEGGVYKISNAGQLYWFAALVNSGENECSGDNGDVYDAVLTADITLNEDVAWTPIGLYTSAREYVRYSGTFDGAGYTIYGLHYDNTAYTGRVAGFIGCLDSNGTVKDLTLAESSINGATDIGGIVSHNYGLVLGCTQLGSVSGTGTTGGIVSRNMDGGRVEGCVNSGSVSGAVTGGIVGENAADAVVADCGNSGSISGTNSVGGIVGINSGSVEDSRNTADVTGENTHVGGVVGNHIGGGIVRCGNSGAVNGGSDYIGGVAGVCVGAEIVESFNTGKVTGADASDAVGGIVGAVDGTNTAKSIITDCYNTGDVTGRSWVGGVAGVSGYQKTAQNVELRSGYNTGAVTGTSNHGAVVGDLNKGTVSGFYYLTGGSNGVSGAAAATAEQFASGELAYALNGFTSAGEPVWKQTLGTDAAPVFEGAVVYYDSETDTYYNDGCVHEAGEFVVENEVAPTCTEDGSYEYVLCCARCGAEMFRETRVLPALGHDWKGTSCTRCDAKRVNPFTDVPETSFYIDAVLWAVEEGITTGTTATTFDPGGVCQRAAVVTFLWRAAGEPEPTTTVNPFTDVKEGTFYYKAVLWAVEEGITNGTTATTFSPFEECNRAAVVTFLWRAMEEPEPAADDAPFSDVNTAAWYGKAVLWAVENGITNGLGDGTFGITQPCNRAQVVTFLYRTLA